MTDKRHILLIENNETEIEFFRDALGESGLVFSLTIARDIRQAFIILNNSIPDIIFGNVYLVINNDMVSLKKLRSLYPNLAVFYSDVRSGPKQKELLRNLDYVQLPGSTVSMGKILRNLLVAQ
jgi:hypothetical protein